MGRKKIPHNQRAQPITFSLKPHLIEKIDDYCHDHRFNRSKFLMEAVTQYMLKNDLNYHSDTNVMEMSVGRRVAVGLTALQEANREGELIPKPIMDALRRELGIVDVEYNDGDYGPSSLEPKNQISENELEETSEKTIKRQEAGLYHIYCDGFEIGHIVKDLPSHWRVVTDDGTTVHKSFKDAKEFVRRDMPVGEE